MPRRSKDCSSSSSDSSSSSSTDDEMEMNNPMWNTKILDIERENRIKERKAALYQKKKKEALLRIRKEQKDESLQMEDIKVDPEKRGRHEWIVRSKEEREKIKAKLKKKSSDEREDPPARAPIRAASPSPARAPSPAREPKRAASPSPARAPKRAASSLEAQTAASPELDGLSEELDDALLSAGGLSRAAPKAAPKELGPPRRPGRNPGFPSQPNELRARPAPPKRTEDLSSTRVWEQMQMQKEDRKPRSRRSRRGTPRRGRGVSRARRGRGVSRGGTPRRKT